MNLRRKPAENLITRRRRLFYPVAKTKSERLVVPGTRKNNLRTNLTIGDAPSTAEVLTNTDRQKHEVKLALYPNPSKGIVHLTLSSDIILMIFDLHGRKVFAESLTFPQSTINLTTLASQTYYYRIVDGKSNRIIFSDKLVIQN